MGSQFIGDFELTGNRVWRLDHVCIHSHTFQECFKANWNDHKKIHKSAKAGQWLCNVVGLTEQTTNKYTNKRPTNIRTNDQQIYEQTTNKYTNKRPANIRTNNQQIYEQTTSKYTNKQPTNIRTNDQTI